MILFGFFAFINIYLFVCINIFTSAQNKQDLIVLQFIGFPLCSHFDCIFCRIVHIQVNGGWSDFMSPHPCLLKEL